MQFDLHYVSKIDDIEDGLITPGIGSDNRAIDILENITEKSIFAGGRIVKARKGEWQANACFVLFR